MFIKNSELLYPYINFFQLIFTHKIYIDWHIDTDYSATPDCERATTVVLQDLQLYGCKAKITNNLANTVI